MSLLLCLLVLLTPGFEQFAVVRGKVDMLAVAGLPGKSSLGLCVIRQHAGVTLF